jgi:fibronectin-binding autotransporter adhesin
MAEHFLRPNARPLLLDQTMPRPPLLPSKSAWWAYSLSLILTLALAPKLPAATVITGDVTPDLLFTIYFPFKIGVTGVGTLAVDEGSDLTSRESVLGVAQGSAGTANIIGPGSSWDNNGDLTIGESGSGMLNVTAGGQLSASSGYLGKNAGSTGLATIAGAGSTWINVGTLRVGESGSGALLVAAGGQVSNDFGIVGFNTGSTGTATITGAGSKWIQKSSFYVGYNGNGALRVEAGGEVSNAAAPYGYGSYLGAFPGSTGTATVAGSGSKWINSYSLVVGGDGSGSLTVEDGGHVTAGTLYASLADLHGNGTIEAKGAVLDAEIYFNAAHPTQVVVEFGQGGALSVTPTAEGGSLGAGYNGLGNLTISEGVAVTSEAGYLGYNAGSTGTATITGAGSKWTCEQITVGRAGSGSLRVEAGGQVRSIFSSNLGAGVGSTGTTTITGVGSKWTNSGTLSVGMSGSGTLRVEAGGEVNNTSGSLGAGDGSTGTATITGVGSNWTNSASLNVGYFGSGALRVEAGGQVSNTTGYVGYSAGSTGTATITGAGSKWSNSAGFHIGYSGSGELRVEAGGLVNNTNYEGSSLGYSAGSTGVATITGVGSAWIDTSSLTIGRSGSGALHVEAGGQISNTSGGYLGFNAGSAGTATIAGAGSKWTNNATSVLYLGRSGSGALRVEEEGQVSNAYGVIGENVGSTGMATVTGAGSTWTNSISLIIGHLGSGELTVAQGGHVTAGTLHASLDDLHGNGTIAATAGAVLDADMQFNSAHPGQARLEFGAGGMLTVTAAGGILGAGYKGQGSLTISEGVAVSSSRGYLGFHSGSAGTATITGAGSKWTNSAELRVGHGSPAGVFATSGALRVEAGGQVSNTTGYLGSYTGSATATITGVGSAWTNSSTLHVGNSGSGALRVEAGGQVSNTTGYLGLASGSTGTATITDAGSKWINAAALYVGNSGSGGLRVETGGQVSNTTGYLGFAPSSMGTATIAGAGAKWTSSSALHVGNSGSGGLRVEAGGQVSNTTGYLGFAASATGAATITGAESKWANSSALFVGNSGSGALTITAGGLVSVRGTLTIDSNGGNDSFVNLATGGVLALWGNADDSLAQFRGLIAGTRAIRYWNASLTSWSPLTAASLGVDYTLQYQSTGDLTGYTLLTVGHVADVDNNGQIDGNDFLAIQRNPHLGSIADWKARFGNQGASLHATTAVPEPASLALLAAAAATLLRRRRLLGRCLDRNRSSSTQATTPARPPTTRAEIVKASARRE